MQIKKGWRIFHYPVCRRAGAPARRNGVSLQDAAQLCSAEESIFNDCCDKYNGAGRQYLPVNTPHVGLEIFFCQDETEVYRRQKKHNKARCEGEGNMGECGPPVMLIRRGKVLPTNPTVIPVSIPGHEGQQTYDRQQGDMLLNKKMLKFFTAPDASIVSLKSMIPKIMIITSRAKPCLVTRMISFGLYR